MKIEITQEIINLMHITDKSGIKVLDYLYYHAEEKRIVATNGNALNFINIDMGKEDLLFKFKPFKLKMNETASIDLCLDHIEVVNKFGIRQKLVVVEFAED